MADNKSVKDRSYNMSRIRSTDTKPEEVVRKWLFANGFRYRKNDKRYPGKPDIVLSRYRTVIFVNGCFWHMHDCKYFVMPSTRREFWEKKLAANKERDERNCRQLESLGWNVITVWECELATKEKQKERLEKLADEITSSGSTPVQ